MSAMEEEVSATATVAEEVSATATVAEEVSATATATVVDEVTAATPTVVEEEKVKRKFTLKSSDDETFEVDEDVAVLSQTIKHMIEDDCADNGIPLPNVTGEILSKVLDYCKKHVPKGEGGEGGEGGGEGDRAKEKDLRNWDINFVKLDHATLFELILAANYLDIKSLLDLVSQTVADQIKDKTVEEVREIFNITNDFTPEEEAEVRKENQWAFE